MHAPAELAHLSSGSGERRSEAQHAVPCRNTSAVGAVFVPSRSVRPPAKATPRSGSSKAFAWPHHQRPAKPGPQFFSA